MKKTRKYLFLIIGLSSATLISAIAIYFPNVGVQQDKATESFKKGLDLLYTYKFEASIPFFLESLSHNPEFPLSRRFLGQALYLSGSFDEAVNEWKVLLDQKYDDPSLKLHIQNLTSITLKSNFSFLYNKTIANSQPGYRYSFPTFVSSFPNHSNFFLSLGQLDIGSLIILNTNNEFQKNYRRISKKIMVPIGAAIGNNELWVTDLKADVIHRLKLGKGMPLPLLNTTKEIGKSGSRPLEFHGPTGICYIDNAYFVVDSGNNRVQKISQNGKFLFSFNQVANSFTLNQPFGIACLANGEILVSEPSESRISIFDRFGNFIRYMGKEYLVKPRHLNLDPKSQHLIIADETNGVHIIRLSDQYRLHLDNYTNKSNTKVKLNRPYSATIDHFGNLLIAQYASSSILHFVSESSFYSNYDLWVERIDANSFPTIGVWVSVKNQSGDYLTDLSAQNFQIIENDTDIGLLGDGYLKKFNNQITTSIVLNRSKYMKRFKDNILFNADFLLKELRVNDKIKAIAYSNDFHELSPFTNSRLKLRDALSSTLVSDFQDDQNSATDRTLFQSITQLMTQKGKKALIWMTDGNLSPDGFKNFSINKIKNYAKVNHIPIYIISFENISSENFYSNKKLLKSLSQATGGQYYSAFKNQVRNITRAIRKQKNEQIVLSYTSGLDAKSFKEHFADIKVIVRFQNKTGLEKLGYFIP